MGVLLGCSGARVSGEHARSIRGYARATWRAKFRGTAAEHVSQLAGMLVARSRCFLGLSALSVLTAGAAGAFAIGDLAACASSTGTTSTDGAGAGDASEDGNGGNGGNSGEAGSASDAGSSGLDAAADGTATGTGNVDGPGAEGATCSFNRDCHLALRCECDETTGCACKTGTRGTGKNGVDPCASGNDCASSVCVEGPPDSGSFCSDECKTSNDCTGVLPLCSDIAFVGRICIRTAPQ